GMSLERKEFLPRLRSPHLHRLVPAGADQTLAVGAEDHAAAGPGIPQGEDFLSLIGIPHFQSGEIIVSTYTGETLPVGTVGHADLAFVPLEGEEFRSLVGVPHPHRPVLTRTGEALAVGAESHIPPDRGT